jgi:hypothetical protein
MDVKKKAMKIDDYQFMSILGAGKEIFTQGLSARSNSSNIKKMASIVVRK